MVTPFADGVILSAGRRAAFISIDALVGEGALLVLAPHPDDETLGCGAALSAASQAGYEIIVAALTDGRLSHPRSKLFPPERLIALRQQELRDAVAILTGKQAHVIAFSYRDQGMTQSDLQEARERLLNLVEQRNVGTIWTTWEHDPHPDHQMAARLARAVAAMKPGLAVWKFPIWGRFIEQGPEEGERLYRFAIEAFRQQKAAGIAAHRSQMTQLISDDPDGFVMDERTQRHFLSSPELFLRGPVHA